MRGELPEHGTYSRYKRYLCHCPPCQTEGTRRRNRERKARELGIVRFVDAAPVRAYAESLVKAGMTPARISTESGVERVTVRVLLGLIKGRKPTARVRPETAEAIMRVRPTFAPPPAGYLDGLGTRRRLQALVADGHSTIELGELLGTGHSAVGQYMVRPIIMASTAHKVAALFDELQLTPGTSAQARRRGIRERWALPLEWDEGDLDNPAAKPARRARWTPTSTKDERREQVRQLLNAGLTNKIIGERLGVSERTVERDRKACA